MTRRKQHPNPITNVTFSLLDCTRARVRLCYYHDHLIFVGIRQNKPVTGGLGRERVLSPDGPRAKGLLEIAGVQP